MTPRRLRFADDPAGADDATTIVLDPWWLPQHPDPARIPVTAFSDPILRSTDLVTGSLARLDAWAAAAGLPEAFVIDGVPWWTRVRMAARWDARELELWSRVLAAAADGVMTPEGVGLGGAVDELEVPAGRPLLVAAAQAWAAAGPGASPVPVRVAGGGPGRAAVARTRLAIARAARRLALAAPSITDRAAARLARVPPSMDRVADAARRHPDVLAMAWAGAFQVFDGRAGPRLGDPLLARALDGAAEHGLATATLVSGLGRPGGPAWRELGRDATLIARTALPAPLAATAAERRARRDLRRTLRAAARVPFPVGDVDLAAALAARLETFADTWLADEQVLLRQLDPFLGRVRPRALVVDREATRTAVLAAAGRHRIPVVAVQHGMIYPGSPEYCGPSAGAGLRPDQTCVFGEWERSVLTECGYPEGDVLVTGSPRARPLDSSTVTGAVGDRGEVRAEVRRELGAPDARILIVSVAHGALGDLDAAEFLARLLPAPIPGVHVVIKVHPQDRARAGHARLLAALAARAGVPGPASVVRDIDLHRLFAAADAHLGQHSTVLTDAVVAGLPSMIAMGQGFEDPLGHVAAGVAVPVRDAADVRAFMADPSPPTAAARQAFLDAHFSAGDGAAAVGAVLAAVVRGTDRPRNRDAPVAAGIGA